MELIDGTQGQVWTLVVIDDQLFCGHNNGTFLISGQTARRISDMPGGWSYVQTPGNANKVIGGNYSGLALYQKINNRWKFIRQLEGFSESSRTIDFDEEGYLWMAHGYKGLYRLKFNAAYDSLVDITFFNAQNSNLISSDAGISRINDKILFTNVGATYFFNSAKNNFVPYETLNQFLQGFYIRWLSQDSNGNVWYFKDNNTGVLRLREDGNFTDISLPFQKIKDRFVKGFEFLYPLDDENVFFGAEKGFIHYDPSASKNYDYPFKAYIRSMQIFDPDSLFLSSKTGDEIILNYNNNDLEFKFSANDFENSD